MNVLETEWWTMAVPPEWWAEAEDDSILVGDRDDVGCIEFSTLHKESGQFDRAELESIARAEAEHDLSWEFVELGEFSGVYSAFKDDGAAIREWYLANGALLLFITYSCDEDNGGMDDSAVDELLDTLMVVEASEQTESP
ncbi:MAG: hypothetical protein ACJAUG_000730 [Halioglobus sp.]|jgi:hypothetical protein